MSSPYLILGSVGWEQLDAFFFLSFPFFVFFKSASVVLVACTYTMMGLVRTANMLDSDSLKNQILESWCVHIAKFSIGPRHDPVRAGDPSFTSRGT
jgi:hypothetical protein